VRDAVEAMLVEHAEIEQQLGDPAIHADPARARSLGRRYAELTAVVTAWEQLTAAHGDAETAAELAGDDASFAAELPALRTARDEAEQRLHRLLVPRDPDDSRDVILEVKAGEGGEESALFAADLVRMYLRYAERRGWGTQVLDATESDLGGYKDVSVAVRARGGGPDDGVWARLKYEGGVHRVQRVPVTESQGRVHTSAAGVLVLPEVEEAGEVELDPNDLRIDVYRSSGPGGQSVNTTDSAVRITHLPTGIVASCQNEKSQLQNKEQALRILRARIRAVVQEQADADASAARRSQVRTVDRSERIRTYNYPENRISDHRTGYKAYNLDQVLDGDLDPVVQSAVDADDAARMTEASLAARPKAGAR
jgi:peptide chain release factor 1